MRNLLALLLSLTMLFFVAATTGAQETRKAEVSVEGLQQIELPFDGPPEKDYCNVWMYDLQFPLWAHSADWFGPGCGFKTIIDPDWGENDCIPPHFPFCVSKIIFGLHALWAPDTVEVVFDLSLEKMQGVASHPCGVIPMDEVWRSDPYTIVLAPGWYGWIVTQVIAPPFDLVILDEPFFASWNLLNDPNEDGAYVGWLTDDSETAFCGNWLDAECLGEQALEFAYELGWMDGNLLFKVGGGPYWNMMCPVVMGSLGGVPGDGKVILSWRTMSEVHNDHWVIRRDDEIIARLDGQGQKETPTDYTYADRDVINGVTYSYTIAAVDFQGIEDIYGPALVTPQAVAAMPEEFALLQNYPNPFNSSTNIHYRLSSAGAVTLRIYNIKGQLVGTLVDEVQATGDHIAEWDSEDMSSGIYICTLTAGHYKESKKMVLMR